MEPHANSLYYQRDYRKRREPHSHFVFTMAYTHFSLPLTDGASLFINKTSVKSYEITKPPLTYSPSFMGYEAFRLDHYPTMHLRDATLHCRFRVLLLLDALECSSGVMLRGAPSKVIPSCHFGVGLQPCPQPETLNLSNLYTRCLALTLGSTRGTSQSNFGLELHPRAPGRGSLLPSNPYSDMTVQVDQNNNSV